MTFDLTAARAHFQRRRELRGPILVPEWVEEGAHPLEIYYKVSTMEERTEIFRLIGANDLEGFIVALIRLARDKHDNRLFSMAQRKDLMKTVDPDVIMRVVNEMRADEESEPDDLGNS